MKAGWSEWRTVPEDHRTRRVNGLPGSIKEQPGCRTVPRWAARQRWHHHQRVVATVERYRGGSNIALSRAGNAALLHHVRLIAPNTGAVSPGSIALIAAAHRVARCGSIIVDGHRRHWAVVDRWSRANVGIDRGALGNG